MRPEVRCATCGRSLVELGSMLNFKGEDICGECFKKRVDGGDFSKIDSFTVHETMTHSEAVRRYGKTFTDPTL